jgi:AcrR family transcriptional regulator
MPRWDPDADGRLLQAAMELFLERGYEHVTVAEIAERAGLKKRSFFRYFPDKREVLFAGAAEFRRSVVAGVLDAAETVPPIDAVVASLAAAGAGLTNWGEPVRLRQQVIATSAELRERELIKLADLTIAIAEALCQRGSDEPTASMTAHAGITVFATAFARWTAPGPDLNFTELMHDSLECLREAISDRGPGPWD